MDNIDAKDKKEDNIKKDKENELQIFELNKEINNNEIKINKDNEIKNKIQEIVENNYDLIKLKKEYLSIEKENISFEKQIKLCILDIEFLCIFILQFDLPIFIGISS